MLPRTKEVTAGRVVVMYSKLVEIVDTVDSVVDVCATKIFVAGTVVVLGGNVVVLWKYAVEVADTVEWTIVNDVRTTVVAAIDVVAVVVERRVVRIIAVTTEVYILLLAISLGAIEARMSLG
jgi:hypothetical protein